MPRVRPPENASPDTACYYRVAEFAAREAASLAWLIENSCIVHRSPKAVKPERDHHVSPHDRPILSRQAMVGVEPPKPPRRLPGRMRSRRASATV